MCHRAGTVTGKRDERKEKGEGCEAPSTQDEGEWLKVTTMEMGHGALSLGLVTPTLCVFGQKSSLCVDFLLAQWGDLRPQRRSHDVTGLCAKYSQKMMGIAE